MNKQETAAHELEEAAAEVREFIKRCDDTTWSRVTAHDGRTVASLAYHCAAGSDLALGWICQMLSSRPISETQDTHNAYNDAEAVRSLHVSKDTVLAMLDRTTDRAAVFLRSLTDEEVERRSMHGIAEREMSVAQFIGNFGRHMRGHLQTLTEASNAG